ncbi:6-bladed beta-propeller [candidate division KSB1 bacterium]
MSRKSGWSSFSKMGGMDVEDENFQFFYPWDVLVENTGSIYILDMQNHRIQKFDGNGKYLLTIGRQGQGPGEFQEPHSIVAVPGSNIHVSDKSVANFRCSPALPSPSRLTRSSN